MNESKGCLTANSLTDIYYVLTKTLDASGAKQAIRKLMELFAIISIDEVDCINALELPTDDFEDALIVVCAEKVGIDYIVSRDAAFQKEGTLVPVISPAELFREDREIAAPQCYLSAFEELKEACVCNGSTHRKKTLLDGGSMKVLLHTLLWMAVWLLATAANVLLRDVLDGWGVARALRALVVSASTGLFMGAGYLLHGKIKRHFGKKGVDRR